MKTTNDIPTYTKVGIKVTTVIMLILLFLLTKNCVRSVRYGTTTSDQEIQQQYDMGYTTGLMQGENKTEGKEPQDNPMLIKAYRKGYRAGRDKARTKENTLSQ